MKIRTNQDDAEIERLTGNVRDVGRLLANSEQGELYCSYLTAVCDAEAVEGSLFIDNLLAAQMLQGKAREVGDMVLAGQNLATIAEVLRVMTSPYRVVPDDDP